MKKRYICVIPARKGSKRIKNKNIIKINNKPIISYVISTAKKTNLFKEIIVSTDSKKIKKISEKYGASVPFIRDKNISGDHSLSIEVLKDVIKKRKIQDKYIFFFYPTSILVNFNDIKRAFSIFKRKKADCLISVKEFESNPLRMLFSDNNFVKFKFKKYQKKNSQNLEKFYFDAGYFYIFRTEQLINSSKFLPKKTIMYKLKKYSSIDLNEPEDLKFLKFLFKYNSNGKF